MKYERRNDDAVFLRLLAVLILLTVIPCAVIGYVIYSMDRSRHMEQTAVLLSSLAADRELATRLLIERRSDTLGFIAKDPKTARLARELPVREGASSDKILDQMVKQSPFFTGLSVVDISTGRHRTSGTFPDEIIERSMMEIRQNQDKPFFRVETLPDGERALLFGHLIQGWEKESGSSAVLLGLSMLTIFDDLYRDTSMLGTTGESFLTDSKGIALTTLRYPTDAKHGHPINAEAMLDCLAGNSKAFVITEDYLDVPTAMSYRPVQDHGGCVMVHMRASEVMAPVNTMRNMVASIVAIIITAVALIAFLVVRKLLRMDKERKLLEDNLAKYGTHLEAMVAERTFELENEIMRRAGAELNLRENEAFLENIVHTVHEVIFAIKVEDGEDFRLMWWNANGEKMTGAKSSEAAGRAPQEVFGPETGGRLGSRCSECIRNGVTDFEENFSTPDGTVALLTTMVPVKDETGRVVRIIGSAMDITERKKLETEMVKAQKLESLGVLAGGIAHDFNNLLAVIRLNVSMLKRSAGLDPDSLEMLKLVDNSTLLATNLTNQLLTFAKGGKPVMKAVPVREFLDDVVNFSLRGTRTVCKLNLAQGLLDMEADSGQMMQVLNNMLINAAQAMPEGGVVTLSAENIELTGNEKGLPLKRGRYVKITVEDHGIGIPQENLSRIFDPYFTTKKKGSGLGLASSYSIIKNHNGHISVRSSVGRGAVFEVLVPALAKKPSLDAAGA